MSDARCLRRSRRARKALAHKFDGQARKGLPRKGSANVVQNNAAKKEQRFVCQVGVGQQPEPQAKRRAQIGDEEAKVTQNTFPPHSGGPFGDAGGQVPRPSFRILLLFGWMAVSSFVGSFVRLFDRSS